MIEELLAKDVLFEDDCLEIVNGPGDEDGPISATALLEVKFGNLIERRFDRLNTTMIKLLDDVRKVFPDAEYYTGSGGFNLMLGHSHNETATRGQQELVALSGKASVGDGDF